MATCIHLRVKNIFSQLFRPPVQCPTTLMSRAPHYRASSRWPSSSLCEPFPPQPAFPVQPTAHIVNLMTFFPPPPFLKNLTCQRFNTSPQTRNFLRSIVFHFLHAKQKNRRRCSADGICGFVKKKRCMCCCTWYRCVAYSCSHCSY